MQLNIIKIFLYISYILWPLTILYIKNRDIGYGAGNIVLTVLSISALLLFTLILYILIYKKMSMKEKIKQIILEFLIFIIVFLFVYFLVTYRNL